MLLCCGGLAWWGSTAVRVTNKADEIIAIQDEIADISLPEDYEPEAGMSMDLKFFKMQMANYKIDGERSFVVLLQLELNAGDENVDIEKELRKAGSKQDAIDIESSETRTLLVMGEERDFLFAKGKSPKGNVPIRQVSGPFTGRGGSGLIIVGGEEETWDEDQVIEMIQSLSI